MPISRKLTVLAIAVLLTGCREHLDSSVSGVITYQGQPLESALINFHPMGKAPMAYDLTDAKGRYSVSSGSKHGIVPGEYKAEISPAIEGQIPDKYLSISTSGLKFDVKAGKNVIDIPLD